MGFRTGVSRTTPLCSSSVAGDARDDGCHLLELGRQEVDEGREFERHEVASGRRSVAGTFGGEQFLEPVEERVMQGDPAAR